MDLNKLINQEQLSLAGAIVTKNEATIKWYEISADELTKEGLIAGWYCSYAKISLGFAKRTGETLVEHKAASSLALDNERVNQYELQGDIIDQLQEKVTQVTFTDATRQQFIAYLARGVDLFFDTIEKIRTGGEIPGLPPYKNHLRVVIRPYLEFALAKADVPGQIKSKLLSIYTVQYLENDIEVASTDLVVD